MGLPTDWQRRGRAAADAFRNRVAGADAAVHVQDDRERDLLDGDGVADFAGGLAAAAAAMGHEPALYHLDTSDTREKPRVRHLAEEVARVVRARAANPRWIEGQMRHGWRGAAELAQAVDALFAFAATMGSLRGDPFQILFDSYLGDDRVRDFLTQANPEAAHAIARRFDDAIARGMWQPRAQFGRATSIRVGGGPIECRRHRRGWCPGALRPMPTGDGLLVRVRVPECRLSSQSAEALAEAAETCGNGAIDLSARANLQIRGVSDATLADLHRRLDALGLLDPLGAEAEAGRTCLGPRSPAMTHPR
jgi:hypothetical protein